MKPRGCTSRALLAATRRLDPHKGHAAADTWLPYWNSNLISAGSPVKDSQVLSILADKHPSVSAEHLRKRHFYTRGIHLFWTLHSEVVHRAPVQSLNPAGCTPADMVRFFTLWMGTFLQLCHARIYTNDWALRINTDSESVDRMAEKYGFKNLGQVGAISPSTRCDLYCTH